MKQKIKVLVCCLLISRLFLMDGYAAPDWPADMGIQAEAGIVMDVDSGAVIFGQNIHVAYPPASITKILTALLVLENSSLDETVTFSRNAVYGVEEGSGNKLNVTEGDTLSVEDCLYSLILHSCNQAANALAEHVAGSREEFVRMMNERIAELGCTESHFDNPSGLNGDTQYVTAYDMALIAREAYHNEKLVEIGSALSHNIPPTINNPEGLTIYNEHRLVKTNDPQSEFYYPPAVAGKTGYLIKAGNTLVTYAEEDGRRLVSVVLKGSPKQYFVDGKNLLKFGFERFQNSSIPENEMSYTVGETPVEIGGVSYLPSQLELEPGSVITLPKGAEFKDAKGTLTAELPSKSPERAVGLLTYTYHDRKVGQAFLLTKTEETFAGADQSNGENQDENQGKNENPAPENQNRNQWKNVWNKKTFLIGGITLAAFAAIASGILILIRNKKKEEKALALRREERRRRLREDGDEEAFQRILQEKRQKQGK